MPHESDTHTADQAAVREVARRRTFRRSLMLLVWLHLLLVLHFAPPKVMFSGEPTYLIDFSLHYYQVDRAVQAFENFGKLWGYDPLVLAGHPVGALEDLSSKSLELFVIALTTLGLDKALAFNLYVLLVHLVVPFVAWAVARLFRLGDRETLVLVGSWVLLWFFDSFFHWLWYCGMVSWALTSTLALLFAALFYRALEGLASGDPAKRMLRFGIPAALTGALLALIHPFAVFPAGLPALWIYLRNRKSAGPSGHFLFLATVVLAAGAAAVWLLPALGWLHYLLAVNDYLRPGPLYLLSDFLDLTLDTDQTGTPVLTVFRMLVLGLAAYGFATMRRAGDRRFGPLLFTFVSLFSMAYLGGLLPVIRETQPYRQLAPAVLFATVPAALAFSRIASRRVWFQAARPVQAVALVALILLTPRLARSVLFYFPEVLVRTVAEQSTPRSATQLPKPMKHEAPPREAIAVREFLEEALRDKPGRVVVEDFALAEYLGATSEIPILGGYRQRPVPHLDAHLFRAHRHGGIPAEELGAYLRRYAVRFVVLKDFCKVLERYRTEHIRFVRTLGPVRIYETLEEPSYFLRGRGEIVHQGLNSVKVDMAHPDRTDNDLVLRFHWAETLACRPDCRVELESVPGARVGFIRIPDPPPRFEIYNAYRQLHPRWSHESSPLPSPESQEAPATGRARRDPR